MLHVIDSLGGTTGSGDHQLICVWFTRLVYIDALGDTVYGVFCILASAGALDLDRTESFELRRKTRKTRCVGIGIFLVPCKL